MAVDGGLSACAFEAVVIVAGGRQAVDLNRRDAFQDQRNPIGANKPFRTERLFISEGAKQGVEQNRLSDKALAVSPIAVSPRQRILEAKLISSPSTAKRP